MVTISPNVAVVVAVYYVQIDKLLHASIPQYFGHRRPESEYAAVV